MTDNTWNIKIQGEVEITAPADISDLVTYVLLEQEDWCEDEIGFVREFIEAGMTTLDLDAGYGVYALAMAQEMEGEGKVIALNTYEHFSQSVQKNGLQDLIATELDDSPPDFIRLGEAELDEKLLQQGDPLLMFPASEGLIKTMQNLDLKLYRYVPALNVLVLYHDETTKNLFACNKERADRLSEMELLVLEEPVSEVESRHSWEILGQLPYTETLLSLWRSTSLDPAYEQAITSYISSWDESLSIKQRYALLKLSLDKLETLGSQHAAYTITLIRILLDLGLRKQASNQASQLLKYIGEKKTLKMDRPFVPPMGAFDYRPVKKSLGQWLSVAIMEALEKQRAYTSYHQPDKHQGLLKPITNLPDCSIEMQRRIFLTNLIKGKNIKVNDDSPLLQKSEENRNPWFWKLYNIVTKNQKQAKKGVATNSTKAEDSKKFDEFFYDYPIVIGGCGRSGTTLLISILSCHSEIYCIGYEFGLLCPTAYSDNIDLTQLPKMDELYRFLKEQNIPEHKKKWAQKTPKNVLFFSNILAAFGNRVKLIHVVRDPRDVITSKHPSNPDSYYVPIERWITEAKAGKNFYSHENVLTLRYEDLVSDYLNQVRRICSFIDLEYDPRLENYPETATLGGNMEKNAWFGSRDRIKKSSMGRWKDDKHTGRINQLMQNQEAVEIMEFFGYLS